VQLRRRRPGAAGTGADGGGPWIVLGLGNPDDEGYANTRHNAGAMVVARLAERAGTKLKRSRNRAQVAEIRDGGTAGHNGLKDVAKALGSPDFLRVRIGVGRPPGRKDPADYVLEPIARRDAEDFAVLIERAADATMDLVHLPLERAQDRHNH
jgi:peptidyl-tRNA hydrolase